MSVEWDIDSYRTEFETEEHWELKKRFMLAHKDKFPEDELVCLAQVFTNIEFLGCRYPEQTMKKVAYLAKGLVEDFREKKKNCLKRTFVAASDAASAKVKGLVAKSEMKPISSQLNHPKQNELEESSTKTQEESSTKSQEESSIKTQEESSTKTQEESSTKTQEESSIKTQEESSTKTQEESSIKTQEEFKTDSQIQLNNSNFQISEVDLKRRALQMRLETLKSGTFPKIFQDRLCQETILGTRKSVLDNFVVLYFKKKDNPLGIITKSTAANNRNMRWSYENGSSSDKKLGKLYFDGEFIAEAEGKTLPQCRRNTAKAALARLKKDCYGIKMNKAYRAVGVSNTDFSENESSFHLNLLREKNIGAKLMLLMGWKGGGLGRKEQGIIEPITPNILGRREGLGCSLSSQINSKPDLQNFKKKAEAFIKNWLKSDSKDDLLFSPKFTAEERKELHSIAQSFGVKSKSKGKKNNRRLLISRKQHPLEILNELLREGGSTKKFLLVYPQKMTEASKTETKPKDS